ncbi:DUF2934 domain-containing protein [Pseudorhodoferax sp. Leaf265]|uniref:DUF2934 domain-containing protein n=1 Tax=Pseudorhodoferax sp. Leaf265 TaxID=1736315 RepID=UPI0006FA9DAE|nr:DUF2934 domain-containing protein [Pseudorhodoferax sp. Leaf265]KQP06418.1 hypothetical protein ASF45_10190 [Pseudorhodoferax sp. Leaf265]
MTRSRQHTEAEPAAATPGADAPAQQQQQQGVPADASREQRIREAAYAAAERRGFAPGHEVDDWLEAERQTGASAP